jgi:hypothetical protein
VAPAQEPTRLCGSTLISRKCQRAVIALVTIVSFGNQRHRILGKLRLIVCNTNSAVSRTIKRAELELKPRHWSVREDMSPADAR